MGGHGGLNILPQKRWNVYNYENREKVRRDEEAAAREEQLKREEARKRDAEFRLEQLRAARGLAPLIKPEEPVAQEKVDEPEAKPEPEIKSSNHINLFEGIKIFDPIKIPENNRNGGEEPKKKKMKKEEVRVVTAEDEKYRLGYGIAGKGVKLPWYLERRNDNVKEEKGGDGGLTRRKEEVKKSGKKSLEDLREERLKREKREKERERALLREKSGKGGRDSGYREYSDRWFSRR